MTMLKGKVLNFEERKGTSKEGKPYSSVNCLVMDDDNDVTMVHVFLRDDESMAFASQLKCSQSVQLKIEKLERMPNRTFDALGQFVIKA